MTDSRGYRRPLCQTCDQPQNSPRHHGLVASGPQPTHRPSPGARAAAAPTPLPPKRANGHIRTPAAEMVVLAVAIDAVLALPSDVVRTSLRVRLESARAAIDVPVLPTLAPQPDPEPDAEPSGVGGPTVDGSGDQPGPSTRSRPEAPPTAARTMVRGIRNDRVRKLVLRAVGDGWTPRRTGSGHVALDKGDSTLILSASATGNARSWQNARAEAKRHGIDVRGL
jgi:hypothetical protein